MDEAKKQRLEAKGWKVGSVEQFLALTPAEAAYIELKLTLKIPLRSGLAKPRPPHIVM